jgi:hypothetical protein
MFDSVHFEVWMSGGEEPDAAVVSALQPVLYRPGLDTSPPDVAVGIG